MRTDASLTYDALVAALDGIQRSPRRVLLLSQWAPEKGPDGRPSYYAIPATDEFNRPIELLVVHPLTWAGVLWDTFLYELGLQMGWFDEN